MAWNRWEHSDWLGVDVIRDQAGHYPRMRNGDDSPQLTGQIAAVKLRTTEVERIDLIARTNDNRVMHTYWNGSHWSGFADISGPLAGRFTGALAATSPDAKRLEFFAQLEDGSVHWKRWNGELSDPWVHDWVPLTNPDTRTGLGARAHSDCRTDIVSRDTGDGVVYGFTRCDSEAALDVLMTLRELKVHDDCDEVSAGDWFVAFAAGTRSMAFSRSVPQTVIETIENPITVETDRIHPIGRILNIPNVSRREPIVVGVSAIDCDSDDNFVILAIPSALGGSLFTPVGVNCEGKDGELLSGNLDPAGDAVIELMPGQWQHGGTFEVPTKTPFRSGCDVANISSPGGHFGAPAYTAVIDVSTSRRTR